MVAVVVLEMQLLPEAVQYMEAAEGVQALLGLLFLVVVAVTLLFQRQLQVAEVDQIMLALAAKFVFGQLLQGFNK
jgi:predicted component of viral defense system (DUF524 family)